MKNIKVSIALIAVVLLLVPQNAHAVRLGVGINNWLNWWQPSFSNNNHWLVVNSHSEAEPAFLFGPVVSLQIIPRLNISSLFLMGEYSMRNKNFFIQNPSLIGFTEQTIQIKRYDSDSSISINFTPYVRMFFGFKYSNYSYTEKLTSSDTNVDVSIIDTEVVTEDFAPGIGIGLAFPIAENLYILYNGAFIFAFVNMIGEPYMSAYSNVLSSWSGVSLGKKEKGFYRIGMNTKLSLAYNFAAINIVINLGFRYQMFYLLGYKSDNYETNLNDSPYDHFYGIEFSAMYIFDFEKKKKEEKTDPVTQNKK